MTAIASAFTQKKVLARLAMTGEITLRGKNITRWRNKRKKILAAKRAKINTIILPEENEKDVKEIPEKYVAGLTLIYVKTIDEVLNHALLNHKG